MFGQRKPKKFFLSFPQSVYAVILVCSDVSLIMTTHLHQILSFFEIKGVEKGKWVTINELPDKNFLQAYTTKYKGFNDRFLRVRCGPRCPQVIYAPYGSYSFPIYWIGSPLSLSGFDFDKLNNHEVKSLAILDFFCMMKVRDLLSLHEEQVLSFLGNRHLFSLCITRGTTLHFDNFFPNFSYRKND